MFNNNNNNNNNTFLHFWNYKSTLQNKMSKITNLLVSTVAWNSENLT